MHKISRAQGKRGREGEADGAKDTVDRKATMHADLDTLRTVVHCTAENSADRGCDMADHVTGVRTLPVTPHVARQSYAVGCSNALTICTADPASGA